MEKTTERTFLFDNHEQAMSILGFADKHIRMLEEQLDVEIHSRNSEVHIHGTEDNTCAAIDVLNRLADTVRAGDIINEQQVRYYLNLLADPSQIGSGIPSDLVCLTYKGKPVKCKNFGQKYYINEIKHFPIVFGIGPAGTGKTFLAVAMAVKAYREKLVSRIVLTRPAVEAGERLGFLPGDLQDKVDPYLRPLYDSLHILLGIETCQSYMERGIIEVAPLAYMRGRTLDDAFIILDEAQNTTPEQMKMFLTRMGVGSRAIITGDITQIDLPNHSKSGLLEAKRILAGVDGISFVYMTARDVVRHELVQRIILAYENDNAQKQLS